MLAHILWWALPSGPTGCLPISSMNLLQADSMTKTSLQDIIPKELNLLLVEFTFFKLEEEPGLYEGGVILGINEYVIKIYHCAGIHKWEYHFIHKALEDSQIIAKTKGHE
ncbi:hypothetical protein DSO57_1021253 [Entomophthora muscae]|uniref:Uncharacterized protein n=1 Tax=Entomophthora muscae TaxID=34485 RepID=A0ACC2UP06_9FUNG|nr:hypothetical protein DSO57_1021253 [Entomophthora muscae]